MKNEIARLETVDHGRPSSVAADSWTLSVDLRLAKGGPCVLRERVSEADLFDSLAECWLETVLRKGHADVPLEELQSKVVPLFSESGATCLGYTMDVTTAGGHSGRRDFTIYGLESVASRGSRRLIARGDMSEGGLYYFGVSAERSLAPTASEEAEFEVLEGHSTTRAVDPLTVPIAPLIRRSRPVGQPDEDRIKVFYTEEALARAEVFSRAGANSEPVVETGGVLIGSLARCPDTGDLFVLVLDVLEATDAEQEEFSLVYSGQTWDRIQTVMKAMQSRPATSTHRILGQCHGHNFPPMTGKVTCEACPRLEECSRSSVFVSSADLSWSRAVFRRQPWHLCHIFGLNARREKVQGLFGLRDGRLLERGFYVIPDFEVEGSRDA